ncbi:MAG: hypothetical protein IKJ83_02785 [Ruminococcus sp.]|nr:hypothetical protein [Ruminococcus sp.]
MKDYNEMAKAVFERRDEYLAVRKKKKAMLLKAGVPVCSLLLVCFLGVTIWMAKMPEIPVSDIQQNSVSTQTSTEPTGTENDVTNYVPETQGTITAKPSQGALASAPNIQNNIDNPIQKPTNPHIGDKPQTGGQPDSDKPQTSTTPRDPEAMGGVKPNPNLPDPTGAVDATTPNVPIVPGTTSPAWEIPSTQVATEWPDGYYPLPNDTVPSVSPTVPPITEVPTEPPTGPLEIRVADKTYTAQTGDMVTYTVELEAEEKFEDIQMSIGFNKKYLNAIVPKDEDGEVDYADNVPNMASAHVTFFDDRVGMNAVRLKKFDFSNKKVLMTVDFMVTHPGETEINRYMQEMTIYNNGVYVNGYTDSRSYFTGGKAEVTEGIEFTEYLTITPAAEIIPPEITEKPTEPTAPFVYPEESTDGELLIYADDRVYAADVGQRITYIAELEAEERFESFQIKLLYDRDMLDILPPDDNNATDVVAEEITLPNAPGTLVNYDEFDASGWYGDTGHLIATGSLLRKYDFRARKVFLQIDFIVKKPGEIELDLLIEEMSIDGTRYYFDYQKGQVITEGINIYQYVIVN